MQTIFLDLRYALRQLRQSPGFTTVALLTLALGIGANTAIFSVVNAALLRSLPYSEPDRLAFLDETRTAGTFNQMEFSYPDYLDFGARNQSFSDIGGYAAGIPVTYSAREGGEKLLISIASANFFDVLGVQPLLGRTFLPKADMAKADKAVLLSFTAWQKRFGGDPAVLGKRVTLDGSLYSIIGVLPHNFQFAPSGSTEFWLPLEPTEFRLRRSGRWINGVGRLKPGVTIQQAQAEANTIARQLEAQYPESDSGVGIAVTPLRELLLGNLRPVLLVLMAAVGVVLLITCSNLAGLQLARSVARQKEIAVRAAMGASRWQIVRLLITESMMIAILGGAAGIVLANLTLPILIASLPTDQQAEMPFLQNVTIDKMVLTFSVATSIFAGLLFGIVPALQGAGSNIRDALQDASHSTAGSLRHRLRDGLVVSQVALAIVLLMSAGLLMKSLVRLLRVDPGFTVAHLLTFETSLPPQDYPDSKSQLALERDLRARLQQLPSVQSAATVEVLPAGNGGGSSRFVLAGHIRNVPAEQYEANTRDVSPNYFQTMDIPLRAGRTFTEHDDESAPRVVVISQTLANSVFPGQDPIGKRIDFTYTKDPLICEIIGVVGDENLGQLDRKTTPVIYEAYAQGPDPYMAVVVRTTTDPGSLAEAVRETVRRINPSLPVSSVSSMGRIIAESPSVAMRKYPAYLIGAFATLALFLAMLIP